MIMHHPFGVSYTYIGNDHDVAYYGKVYESKWALFIFHIQGPQCILLFMKSRNYLFHKQSSRDFFRLFIQEIER